MGERNVCVFGGDVRFEPGEKGITVFGDRAQQTRPVALPRAFDGWPCTAWFPRGTRLDLHAFLGVIDTDYCSVHFPPFFELTAERFLLVSIGFNGCTVWFLIAQSRFLEQPSTTRDRAFDIVRLVEILQNERRRPHRRVEPNFLGRVVNSYVELLLLCL